MTLSVRDLNRAAVWKVKWWTPGWGWREEGGAVVGDSVTVEVPELCRELRGRIC